MSYGRAVVALLLLAAGGHARAQMMCPTGQFLCGTSHCSSDGTVCCADVGREDVACPGGTTCLANGTCMQGMSCSLGDGGVAGAMLTIAGCGGDSCGCSSPCQTGRDCESGCCTTGNLCAPECVCSGVGRLFLDCNTSSTGFTGKTTSTCGVAAGAAPQGNAAGLVLLVAALVLLSCRRRAADTRARTCRADCP